MAQLQKITYSKLNLSLVTKSLLRKRRAYKWSVSNVHEAVELYRMFLYLCGKYPRLILVPTAEIDFVWHEHILHTRKYHRDCKKLFGRYLHHNPGIPSGQSLRIRFNKTLELVRKEFPEADA